MTVLNHTTHNSVAENYFIKFTSLVTRGESQIFQMATIQSQGAESPPQINTELYSATISWRSVATSVPSNEDRIPLPDWSWRGRAWPICSRGVTGSHEAVNRGWPDGAVGSVRSWAWPVLKVSSLSGGDYGHARNEIRLGAGDGVAAGGGAKPSPASGAREEHQLYCC